jgi:flavodoxin
MGMKALIVYYSNSGTTKVLAEKVAAAIGGDLEEIVEQRPRPRLVDGEGKPTGGFIMARSALSAFLGIGSSINPGNADPAAYDVVIVGTPVWVGSLVPPVRSYLKRNRKKMKAVALFCSCGQNEKLRAISQMAGVASMEPLATMTVEADDVKKGECEQAVRDFSARIRSASTA